MLILQKEDNMENEKKKPEVKLLGEDGNAYFILARVSRELKKAGYTPEEIKEYDRQATSGDYDNLLRVTMEWVEIV